MGFKFLVFLTTLAVTTAYLSGVTNSPHVFTNDVTGSTGVVATESPTTALNTHLILRPEPPATASVGNKNITRLDIPEAQAIYIVGPIMANAHAVVEELKTKAKKNNHLYLLIDSPGGSVLDGAAIVSAMEASTAKIDTVCLSMCASMAFIIHQYGNKRYAIDRSVLMAHPASGGVQGTMEQMKARLDLFTRYVDKLDVLITKRVGLPFDSFKQLITSEFWVDSEDAFKANYVDGLVDVTTDAKPAAPNFSERYRGTRELKDSMKFMWGGEEALLPEHRQQVLSTEFNNVK